MESVVQLLPVIEKIAANLSRKHKHDQDDLKGQGTLFLMEQYLKAIDEGIEEPDLPRVLGSRIKFKLIQWMSHDKLIPRNYKTAMRCSMTIEGLSEQHCIDEPQSLVDLRDALKQLPETPSEQIYVDMKLEGYNDEDVCQCTGLAVGTIKNMKSKLRKRFYGDLDNDCCPDVVGFSFSHG